MNQPPLQLAEKLQHSPTPTPSIPNFLIVGVQKGGTTSLYNYLIQHPHIAPASEKEVHFFDLNFHRGLDWYHAQFPRVADGKNLLTGEASPYYIFHPRVPPLIHQHFPQVKLIVLLRNPVERAISHYYYYVKIGFEKRSLEDAIATETELLAGETELLAASPNYYSFYHRHYTYLARGRYLEQLQTWWQYFPQEQLLILKSEDFYTQPAATFNTVLDFLELPSHHLETYIKYNTGTYPPVSAAIQQQLREYFRPYNQQLTEYLGRDFNWD